MGFILKYHTRDGQQSRSIGIEHPPFIIAELSGNHNGSLEKAIRLIDAAADSGAHAIKLQTYTADSMTLNLSHGEFVINDSKSLWKGRSLYDLYQEAHTPLEWHEALFERSRERNLICFSTPFDVNTVDFLEQFNPPIYKIASFENIDLPLIKRVAQTKKPMIISTGMATVSEIEQAVMTARTNGCESLVLLKCTSSYPANPTDSNLLTIPHLRELFRTEVGLSDHTMGCGVACAAIALGATVVEKHLTHDRSEGGVDSAFSLEPTELKSLVQESVRSWQAIGKVSYGPTPGEIASLQFRRSIYIVDDLQEGEILTEKNIRCIRPGHGLAPSFYESLLGKRINRNLTKGSPMKMDYIL